MATLQIIESYGLSKTSGEGIPIMKLPQIATQNLSISASSAQSSALNADTAVVRLQSDTDCYVEVGTNPTATTSSLKLIANAPEYFGVARGASFKIAART